VGECVPDAEEDADTEDPGGDALLPLSLADAAGDRCTNAGDDWRAEAVGVRSEDAGSEEDRTNPEEDPVLFVSVPVISCEEPFELV
jgi:hypothetical protein